MSSLFGMIPIGILVATLIVLLLVAFASELKAEGEMRVFRVIFIVGGVLVLLAVYSSIVMLEAVFSGGAIWP